MGHLLLVDNDPDILELLRLGLADLGYDVRTAANGVEALRSIEDSPPDVLITDLIMPNISGEKLLRIVRSVPEWNTIRTIVVSGVATEAPEIRAQTPCDIYIAKGPIGVTLQYLRDSLRNFERMRELARTATIGADGIFSRHITRELLEFKQDVDRILDHVSDGVSKLDESLTLVYVNQAFTRMIGRSEEQVLGRTIQSVVGRDAHTAIRRITERGRSGDHAVVEVSLADERLARITVLYSFTEHEEHAALMWQDVTERLLLEEQYENIVESSRDVIFTIDMAGRLSYVSRSSRRILGLTPQDLLGHPIWTIAAHGEREALHSHVTSLIELAESATLVAPDIRDFHFAPPDGPPRWGRMRTSMLIDRAGRTIGLQGTISDITEQRRLIEEREALLHEVHHRVRDNLQLVASLTRLSRPEFLERRIGALGEVFDELYREASFSDISPGPLLQRVVTGALAGAGELSFDPAAGRVAVDRLPMRRVVPLALLVNELVQHLSAEEPEQPYTTLRVSIEPVGEAVRLIIAAGTDNALGAIQGRGCDPLDEESLTGLMVAQLGGTGCVRVGPGAREYVVEFA